MKRRDFLKIGGTLGTGSLVLDSCGKPDQKLIPLLVSEEELVPGTENWVASLCQQCPAGCGITVRVMQGESVRTADGQARRIKTAQAKKIEGNPKHPLNLGKTCARGQAGLQVLYNPDRIQSPLKLVGQRGSGKYQSISWTEAIQTLVDRLSELQKSSATEGLVMLTGTKPRASMKTLLDRFARAFGTPHQISCDLLEHKAWSLAASFGMPVYDIANTRYLLSLGANLFETFLSPVRYSLAYGQMRQGRPGIRGKFVQAEPRLSLTAANADEWLPIRPETQALLALSLAQVIVRESLYDKAFVAKQTTGFEEWSETLSRYSPELIAPRVDIPAETILRIAREFAERQPSLAIGDSKSVSGMLAIHTLNALVGNYGKPGGVLFDVSPTEPALPLPKELIGIQDLPGSVFELPGLLGQEPSRPPRIKAILLFESNPLFLWPKPRELFEAFNRVPFIASFASFLDESTIMADLILPSHTYLERWQDDIPQPGIGIPIRTLAQPVVKPRFDTRDPADVLLNVARSLGGLVAEALPWKDSVALIQDHFRPLQALKRGSVVADQFKDFWAKAKQQGGWWDTEATESSSDRNPSFNFRFGNGLPGFENLGVVGQADDFPFLLHLYPSIGLSDGRGANQPWLQEMPDPMTSIMWNSWVEINPQTASRLGIQEGDVLTVESPVGKVELPAYLYPGLRPDVIAIPIGQGHHTYGRYAGRGANPLELAAVSFDPESLSHVHGHTRVRIRLTGRRMQLPKFGSDVREHSQEALRR